MSDNILQPTTKIVKGTPILTRIDANTLVKVGKFT